eukprot:6197291-Pleurochrysis_carterae.AAC.1
MQSQKARTRAAFANASWEKALRGCVSSYVSFREKAKEGHAWRAYAREKRRKRAPHARARTVRKNRNVKNETLKVVHGEADSGCR